MKPAFISVGRLEKNLSSIFLGCLLAVPFAAVAQQDTYTSPANVTGIPPNVDATNFINAGSWDIGTTAPYETANTLNYTNTGTMLGSVGWEFDFGTSAGGRSSSANFFNGNGAVIEAADGEILNPYIGTTIAEYLASYLIISATNIVNDGTLAAGPNGEIVLNGSQVNLGRSAIEITPDLGIGSINGTSNFLADTAIYDEYWNGAISNKLTVTGSPWNGTTMDQFTFFNVRAPCGVTTDTEQIGPLVPQASDSLILDEGPYILTTTNSDLTTNIFTVYSNIVHQAIFVYVSDSSIVPSTRFGQSLNPTNLFRPMAAQLATVSTNAVTGEIQDSTIYVVDSLGSVTNEGLLPNTVISPSAICTDPTYRPATVVVSRIDPGTFAGGFTGLGPPPATFFYEPFTTNAPLPETSEMFSNVVATGIADVYSALIDNLAQEPPPGFSISNAPGYIHINANNLDLSKTRMSASSEIMIHATNLIGSAGAVMDCQNLSYNLGSTSGSLIVTNLAVPTVQRLHGTVSEWSGMWTNHLITTYVNFVTNTAATNAPFYIESDITNVSEVDILVTVVDASGLATTVPVTVQDLVLNSTNMMVSDFMNVTNTMLFNGQSLTIQNGAGLVLATGIQNWNSSIAPTLRYFTNNGVLNIPNDAHFGDDGPTNYAEFINNGTITAGSQTINSVDYQNAGSQNASGGFIVTSSSGKVQNGNIASGQDVRFNAGTLKFNEATITASGQLYLNVTNSLLDAGASSGNVLTCNNGFDLPVKPATGDLPGTELETITPKFAAVDHYWAGLDFGVSSAGYFNNVALGQLILVEGGSDADGNSSEFNFHAIHPTGVTNAIYVDLLDLSKCPDFLDSTVLTIDSNIVIYYAAVKLPSTFTIPPNGSGISQEAEEFLNGQLGGHLRWVSSFDGPNSSVDVVSNGVTIVVNKALRYSKIIDSNGNGVPNYYDPSPFYPVAPFVVIGSLAQTNSPPTNGFAVSWTAAANTAYQVQYRTNMVLGSWQPLLNYTNSASAAQPVTVWDTNEVSGQRYYRVSHP
jgi:hypothetical protein